MRRMTIIGIALVIVGILLGIGLAGGGFAWMASKDPESSNLEVITGPGDIADPGPGTYQIWTKDSISGEITVTRPGGETVIVERTSDDVTFGDFTLFGKFKISEDGNHSFLYQGTGDLYITEDFSLGTYYGMIYAGIIGGITLLLAGIVLIVVGIKRQRAIDHSGFFHEGPPPGRSKKRSS